MEQIVKNIDVCSLSTAKIRKLYFCINEDYAILIPGPLRNYIYGNQRLQFGLRDPLSQPERIIGRIGGSSGFIGGLLGVPRGIPSGTKGGYTYERTKAPQPKGTTGPVSRLLGGVRSLPLGAKVGITGVLTSLASCIGLWAFIRLLNGYGNILQYFSAGFVSIGFVAISGRLFCRCG